MYRENQTKTVVILNKQALLWKVLNAGTHCVMGLAANNSQALRCMEYRTADEKVAGISTFPVILLRGKPGQILRAYNEAEDNECIQVNFFLEEMIGTSSVAQLNTTAAVKLDHATLLAIALFGPSNQLSDITKKFSGVRESW